VRGLISRRVGRLAAVKIETACTPIWYLARRQAARSGGSRARLRSTRKRVLSAGRRHR